MKIDAHQHFWKYSKESHDWINEDMAVIQRDFLPKDLEPVLKANGFSGCVAVQADQTLQETDFLLDLANNHPIVKGVVGWVDLQAENIKEQLEELSIRPKLKGFRHIVQGEPDDAFLLRPAFINGIKSLSDFNFTYDVLVFPKHLKNTKKFLALCPNQPMVLDHIAKPLIEKGEISDWAKNIKDLGEFQNLSCKLSGIITEANWKNWTYEQIVPYLDVVFEVFGTKRLMVGSDWPVCLVAGEYREVMQIVDTYFSAFTESEKAAIFGLNAQEFYSL